MSDEKSVEELREVSNLISTALERVAGSQHVTEDLRLAAQQMRVSLGLAMRLRELTEQVGRLTERIQALEVWRLEEQLAREAKRRMADGGDGQ